jgi:hypothetical protein
VILHLTGPTSRRPCSVSLTAPLPWPVWRLPGLAEP